MKSLFGRQPEPLDQEDTQPRSSLSDGSGPIQSNPSSRPGQQAQRGLEGSSIERSIGVTRGTEPAASGLSGPSGTGQSTEDKLFDAMDRTALKFIDLLNDDSVDDEGRPNVDIAMKFKLFDKAEAWLTKRQKLKPSDHSVEGAGITDMRSWMSDPVAKKALEATIFEMGFVKVPDKKPGRPRKEDLPARERYNKFTTAKKAEEGAQDDSAWTALLEEPKQ